MGVRPRPSENVARPSTTVNAVPNRVTVPPSDVTSPDSFGWARVPPACTLPVRASCTGPSLYDMLVPVRTVTSSLTGGGALATGAATVAPSACEDPGGPAGAPGDAAAFPPGGVPAYVTRPPESVTAPESSGSAAGPLRARFASTPPVYKPIRSTFSFLAESVRSSVSGRNSLTAAVP